MKSKSGLITQEQAAIEIMNVDISRNNGRDDIVFEERDNFELAAKLRGKLQALISSPMIWIQNQQLY
jgi:hypothetical protein